MPYHKDRFAIFLRKMSKKGFYGILQYINEKGPLHYNDVLRHADENGLAKSRYQVTNVLNTLTDYGFLERKISSERPLRTTYSTTKKGKEALNLLSELEDLVL